MSILPVVTVVLSVYNNKDTLPQTLDSILAENTFDIEFVIINDGSNDGTMKILEQYASNDRRIRLINQKNHGLTRSLIRGCALARGKFIARQDAGDVSLPGRFVKQAKILTEQSSVVLVSGGTQFIGPQGEKLHKILQSPNSANEKLKSPSVDHIKGPSHHGCTMFRRDIYERVGGYRPEFIVAQDLDLWTRLVEFGRHVVVPEMLYEATLMPGAISSTSRILQQKSTEIIVECMKARRTTGDDREQLCKLAEILAHDKPVSQHKSDADFYYFISRLLMTSDPDASRRYLGMALRSNPWHYKAWARSLQGLMGL